jgi:hypothetical protein
MGIHRRHILAFTASAIALCGSLMLESTPAWAGAPTATTEPAKLVKRANAVLDGIVNPEGAETVYYFEYGTEACSATCGTKTPTEGPIPGTAPRTVELKITRLKPGVIYSYWIVVSNAEGTAHGEEKTFSTMATEPKEYIFEKSLENHNAGEPFGVGINQVSHEPYVYSRPSTIEHFSFLFEANVVTSLWEGDSEIGGGPFFQLAVNNVAGPELGTVYLANAPENVVDKFDANSKGELTEDPLKIGEGVVSEPRGVAIDSSGNIYVASATTESVSEFSSTGTVLKENLITGVPSPFALGVDAAGDIYVAGAAGTVEYLPTGKCAEPVPLVTPEECAKINSESDKGVAVNAEGDIFVADAESRTIHEYAPSPGHPLIPNLELELALGAPRGVAYDATHHLLYIAEPENEGEGSKTVKVFRYFEAKPVDVTTEPATQINGDVEALNGSVNPGGVESAEYYFEYGPAPCDVDTGTCGTVAVEQGAGPLTGEVATLVSARLENLAPNTTYHFWIVGVNENSGVGHGGEQTFTTGPIPPPPPTPSLEGSAPESKTPASSPSYPLLTGIAPVPMPPVHGPPVITRAQRLAKALAACNRKRRKQRAACKRQARRKYDPVTKSVAKKRRK